METLNSDWLDLLAELQDCSESGAGVVSVKAGSVGGSLPQHALLHQQHSSWPAGLENAVVAAAAAVEGLAGGLFCCGWYEKVQTATCEFAGEGLVMNSSEKEGPGFV